MLAWYNHIVYVALVLGMDEEKNDIHLDVMEKTPQNPPLYQWPALKDLLSVPKADVICTIDPPAPTGRSQRAFRLSKADRERHFQKIIPHLTIMIGQAQVHS